MMKALLLRINYTSIVCPLRPWNYVQILHFVKRSKVCILYSINIVPWQIPANETLLKCSTYFKSHRIVRHSIVLHCTGSHRSTSHRIYCIEFYYMTSNRIAVDCTTLHHIVYHCIALHCSISHCITLYNISHWHIVLHANWVTSYHIRSHCVAAYHIWLHTALHCIAILHCIALHYISSDQNALHFITMRVTSYHNALYCIISRHHIVLHCITSQHNASHEVKMLFFTLHHIETQLDIKSHHITWCNIASHRIASHFSYRYCTRPSSIKAPLWISSMSLSANSLKKENKDRNLLISSICFNLINWKLFYIEKP